MSAGPLQSSRTLALAACGAPPLSPPVSLQVWLRGLFLGHSTDVATGSRDENLGGKEE